MQRLAGNRATRSLIQRQPGAGSGDSAQPAKDPAPSAAEDTWVGSVKGYLGQKPSLYHTVNNFGDQELSYLLRITNTGYALLNLETQYEYKTGGEQRAWIALAAQRGQTLEVTNGLPPNSSLHLRLYGDRDYTQPNQSYIEGTLEVRRKK